MIWANFLHFYQPPTQKKYWVDRITNEAYRPILRGLESNPNAKLTINIAAVLLELWDRYGHQDVIEGYRKLIERGQIEVTGSAKYHPLLPKLPESEIIRQITLNELTLYKYLGVVGPILNREQRTDKRINGGTETSASASLSSVPLFSVIQSSATPPSILAGFFPPEMAFDERIAALVTVLGYRYVICDEYSFNGQLGTLKSDRIYEMGTVGPIGQRENRKSTSPILQAANRSLILFFRERVSSFRILSGQLGTAKLFMDYLGRHRKEGEYLLTAMDGETFGHHRPGMDKLLFSLYETEKINSVTLSQLPDYFKQREAVKVRPATWALMEKDLEKNAPFSRWHDPDNEIHQLQWKLTELAIKTVNESQFRNDTVTTSTSSVIPVKTGIQERVDPRIRGDDKEAETGKQQWFTARSLLDKALHSDQYWWASARPWWSLEMIEAGAKDLQDVVLTVPDAPKQAALEAQSLYFGIITTGFLWQRTNRVEAMSLKEDEELRERTDEGLPKLPAVEIRKMIQTIEAEMLSTAAKREYERAVQLRDRIKELEAYLKE